MIRLLRRSRLLALTLLLATPAFGGAWLQALHPCPVDQPWVAAEDEHGAGHHGAPAGQTEGCHCVGSCSAAGAAVLATSPESLTIISGRALPPRVVPTHVGPPALRPSDRLPPATAPPVLL